MSFHFVQMADPQFGMFAYVSRLNLDEVADRQRRGIMFRHAEREITGFEDETRLYSAAIDAVNEIAPAFAVICGDMVHDVGDESEIAELLRITDGLNADIPMRWVSGNHDVGDAPTPDSLAAYRERFGADNYSFDYDECHFAVINSSVAFDPSNAPGEWDRLMQFLGDDLSAAKRSGARRISLLTHHPLFTRSAEDADDMFIIPRERREPIMRVLRDNGASAVFAGHMHVNNYASDAGLEMITTGAVGYPFGDDPSGLRVVWMDDDAMRHEYHALERPLPSRLIGGGGS